MVMFVCWPVVTLLYYGISFSVDKINLTDDVFLRQERGQSVHTVHTEVQSGQALHTVHTEVQKGQELQTVHTEVQKGQVVHTVD
jgi:folate-dependent phosphoribosylglycinamide formyltransferase PurN